MSPGGVPSTPSPAGKRPVRPGLLAAAPAAPPRAGSRRPRARRRPGARCRAAGGGRAARPLVAAEDGHREGAARAGGRRSRGHRPRAAGAPVRLPAASRATTAGRPRPPRSRSIPRKTTGTTQSVSRVEVITPPMTAMAMGERNSLPMPRPMAVGSMPSTMAPEVMRMGRRRRGPALRMAVSGSSPSRMWSSAPSIEQDGVLGHQPHEQDEADQRAHVDRLPGDPERRGRRPPPPAAARA